jgi:MFS family permease
VINVLKAFIPATILAFVLASVLSTQMILANVQAMGLDVSMGVRLNTTFQDLIGMASSYLILITIAFILGLPVAAWLSRRAPSRSALLFTLAGFVAIAVLHLAIQAALSIHPVPVTRTLPGFLGQCLAGAAGGWCYYRLRHNRGKA